VVQLTNPPFYPKLVRWSPDGAQILFTDYSPSGLETAYVVSSGGGTPMQVLPEDKRPQQGANWSPDGTKIVFSATSDMAAVQTIGDDIQILELASHQVTAIPDSDGMSSPRWSPDGRYIAALTLGGSNLKVFDLETRTWTPLNTGGYPQFPVWARDGHSIYFVRHQDHALFRVSINDQRVEQVAELKDFRHAGWYWLWLGLDPGDAPLLLRDLGSNEIYQLSLE
jgi:Tol biopolymer transport system component